MQYHGALTIAEWAHFVNASILAGEGTVEGLKEAVRRIWWNAWAAGEMTNEGTLATGDYTTNASSIATKHLE